MNRFELQGIVYYQQVRKCGKPDCACAAGELHGPYWYSRDVVQDKISYLGKDLPENVDKARKALQKSESRIHSKIADLNKKHDEVEAQIVALNHLLSGYNLTTRYADLVKRLGFGKCLVSDDAPDREQGQHKTKCMAQVAGEA